MINLAKLKVGDKVSVEGWRGEYEISGKPFFHEQFQRYIAPVRTKNGTIKVFLDECKKRASKSANSQGDTLPSSQNNSKAENTGNRNPWYMKYVQANPRDYGIDNINVKPLVSDFSELTPGKQVAQVKVTARGKSLTMTLYHTGSQLATKTRWKSKEALGAVICRVREHLIRRLG